MKFLSLFTLFIFTFQVAYADDQKATEAAIAAAFTADLPIALTSLETAVNINSGTMNFDGVKAVGARILKPNWKHWVSTLASPTAAHTTARGIWWLVMAPRGQRF